MKCYMHITEILHLYYNSIKSIDLYCRNDKIKEKKISNIVNKRSVIDKKCKLYK